MKKKSVALLITFVLLLVTVIPVAAITWGEPDGGEHPEVGTLIFYNTELSTRYLYSCTGTLISPRVVLTAGHCVETNNHLNDLTWVRFAEIPASDYYPPTFDWLNDKWLEVEEVIAHPDYYDFNDFPYTYDIGVVILAESYTGATPASLPSVGFLETLKGKDRLDFTSVGFGMQGTLPPFFQSWYYRFKGDVALLELNSYLTAGGDASVKFSNNPGIGGGTCYGDSGGPTFYKDTNTTVSVTSFGWAKNGNCVGNDFNYRLDTVDAISFLDDILELYGD